MSLIFFLHNGWISGYENYALKKLLALTIMALLVNYKKVQNLGLLIILKKVHYIFAKNAETGRSNSSKLHNIYQH